MVPMPSVDTGHSRRARPLRSFDVDLGLVVGDKSLSSEISPTTTPRSSGRVGREVWSERLSTVAKAGDIAPIHTRPVKE
jgi:hypothetical protein